MDKSTSIRSGYSTKQTFSLCCFLIPVTIIGILSLVPRLGLPNPFPMFDKVEHTGAYLLLSVLARLCFAKDKQRSVLIFLVVLSITLEFLQILTPPREPDPVDALFNCIGICIGGYAGLRIRSLFRFLDETPSSAADTMPDRQIVTTMQAMPQLSPMSGISPMPVAQSVHQ